MANTDRTEQIIDDIENRQLGLDDTFRFKCYGCGKCCKNREDILLNAQDVYRMAKHLKLEPKQLIDRYCETCIGQQSLIPLVRLLPRGKFNACPLLKDNRCSVHAAKPTVCALFPLGRFLAKNPDDLNAPPEPGYFLQPITCGGHKNNTVHGYLESFGFSVDDPFHVMWSELLLYLAEYCQEAIGKGVPEGAMERLWGAMYQGLYTDYCMGSDFLPQFDVNASKLRSLLEEIKAVTFGQPLFQAKR